MSTDKLLTPEEAARRFRLWRMSHRTTASLKELSDEIKISTKDLQQILSSRAAAGRFTGHIDAFLSAFAAGDVASLKELRNGQSATLPIPHVVVAYTPEQIVALKARQARFVRLLSRPYCQITRQEISPRQCVASQTPRDCYGCGAVTRFCTECQFDTVAFPGAELCAFCLTVQLTDEMTDKMRRVWVISVECKLSGNSQISTATCGRLQGDACSGCNAATRVCLMCTSRRVRYPDFGMCLRCHTSALGFGWSPLPTDVIEAKHAERAGFFAAIEKPRPDPPPPLVQIRVTNLISVPPQPLLQPQEFSMPEWLLAEPTEPLPRMMKIIATNPAIVTHGLHEWWNVHVRCGHGVHGCQYCFTQTKWIAYDLKMVSHMLFGEPLVCTEDEMRYLFYYCYPVMPARMPHTSGETEIYSRAIAERMMEADDTTTRFVMKEFGTARPIKTAVLRLEKRGVIGPSRLGRSRRPILVSSIVELDERLGVKTPQPTDLFLRKREIVITKHQLRRLAHAPKTSVVDVMDHLSRVIEHARDLGADGRELARLMRELFPR